MGARKQGNRQGWKLVWRGDRKQFYVRFRSGAHRHQLATGQSDRGEAASEAERIYANVIKSRGSRRGARSRLAVLKPFEELLGEWLASLEGVLDPTTVKTYEGYAGTHWRAFKSLDDATDDGQLGDYARGRVKVVLRKTLTKEMSALFTFFRWCKEQGALAELPPRPELPKKAKGHRAGKQRERANELSTRQVEAFLVALPEWSHEHRGAARLDDDPFVVNRIREYHASGMTIRAIARLLNDEGSRRPMGGKWHPSQVRIALTDRLPPPSRAIGRDHYPIRAKFLLAYETGLRPKALSRITWGAWTGGTLRIASDLDKNRLGREVPLSSRAIAVLEQLQTARGGQPHQDAIIFGEHDYRATFTLAAKRAGIPLRIAPYDFRHARQTHLIDAGAPATGVMYLQGHTQLATASKYTHPSLEAATAALAAFERARAPLALPAGPRGPETLVHEAELEPEEVRRLHVAVDDGGTGFDLSAVTQHINAVAFAALDAEAGPKRAPDAQGTSAKDGGRTRTGVTPLEPESGQAERIAREKPGTSQNYVRQETAGNVTARRPVGPGVLQSTRIGSGLAEASGHPAREAIPGVPVRCGLDLPFGYGCARWNDHEGPCNVVGDDGVLAFPPRKTSSGEVPGADTEGDDDDQSEDGLHDGVEGHPERVGDALPGDERERREQAVVEVDARRAAPAHDQQPRRSGEVHSGEGVLRRCLRGGRSVGRDRDETERVGLGKSPDDAGQRSGSQSGLAGSLGVRSIVTAGRDPHLLPKSSAEAVERNSSTAAVSVAEGMHVRSPVAGQECAMGAGERASSDVPPGHDLPDAGVVPTHPRGGAPRASIPAAERRARGTNGLAAASVGSVRDGGERPALFEDDENPEWGLDSGSADTIRVPRLHVSSCRCAECIAAWREFLRHNARTALLDVFVERGGEASP